MEKEKNLGQKLIHFTNNVVTNRCNGLVEFGVYLDEMSEILSHQVQTGKTELKDLSEMIKLIKYDYKFMVSNRMNELTKKTIKK
jgi:hypothetical protein